MRNRTLFVLAAVLLTAPALFAQQPPTDTQPMSQMHMQHGQPPSGQMAADCQAMMQKMQSMHAGMKAMDDRLAALVNDMNKAKGSAKVDRIAAVVNELVAQRQQMRDQMETMMPQMMSHMMGHMQSGMTSGMQSMANCPMMKGSASQQSQPAAPEQKH